MSGFQYGTSLYPTEHAMTATFYVITRKGRRYVVRAYTERDGRLLDSRTFRRRVDAEAWAGCPRDFPTRAAKINLFSEPPFVRFV